MSPTVQTLLIGFITLILMAIIGKVVNGTSGMNTSLFLFFPIWLAYTAWHMYVGVSQHGYSVKEELPFLLLNFGVPALAAYIALRK